MSTMNQAYSDPQGKNIGVDAGQPKLDIYILERDKYWSMEKIKALIRKLARYKQGHIVVAH